MREAGGAASTRPPHQNCTAATSRAEATLPAAGPGRFLICESPPETPWHAARAAGQRFLNRCLDKALYHGTPEGLW